MDRGSDRRHVSATGMNEESSRSHAISVLIGAPVGGVGTIPTPWAAHLGARVIAVTSSAAKAEKARALGVRAVFAERRDGCLTLRRGFQLDPGERILVVEDVITTGNSTRETIDVARDYGGDVVGAASVINRGGPDLDVNVHFEALAEASWPTYAQSACPLCNDGLPITQPGSRSSL